MNVVHRCPQIQSETELNQLLAAHDRVAVLIGATWCPFCREFFPIFDQHSELNANVFTCVLLDDQEILADKYAVPVVPTVLYFEKGKIVKRLDGVLGVGLHQKQLQSFMKSLG